MVHPPLDVGANSTGRKSTSPFRTGALLIGRISRWSMLASLFKGPLAATATTIAGPAAVPSADQSQRGDPLLGGGELGLGLAPFFRFSVEAVAQIGDRGVLFSQARIALRQQRPQPLDLARRCRLIAGTVREHVLFHRTCTIPARGNTRASSAGSIA